MKKGWQSKTLGETCEVVNGGTPKTGVSEYWDGQHRWITPAEMGKRLSPYVSETERMISDLGLRNSSAQMLPPHSVILSSRAPIGHLVINTELMATNQGCKGLIPRSQLQHKFLYYYLSSIVDLLNSLGTGATFKELSGGKLKEVEIPVPSLAEQQRIVGLLDEAFEGLATAKANAEKNLQNARALFESHLQSVFTQRGPGWVETTLENVLTVQPQNGWSPPAAHHAASGTPVLTLSSVTGFVFRPDKLKYTSAKTDPKARYWIQNGDFLITRSNTPELVGHVAIASGIDKPTIYPDLIMRMNPMPDRALTEFLYYQLRTSVLRKEIMGRSQGANPTMKKISNGAVKTLPIAVPSIDTQQAIVETLDALTEETQRLARLYERKLAALEALKKSLLHQAFTGAL
jgi:type I restriction enzyme S subunit